MTLNSYQSETLFGRLLKTLLAGVALIALIFFSVYAHASSPLCQALFDSSTAKTPSGYIQQPNTPSAGWGRKALRLITFNAQDFTLYEKAESKLERAPVKNAKAVKAIAKTLFENNPDIIVLQEVGNRYTLQKLIEMNEKDKDAYEAVFIQGNDVAEKKNYLTPGHSRNIGFLIKKSLNLKVTFTTNSKIPYDGPHAKRKYLFDRGLPILSLFAPNSTVPLFAVIGAHNHSIGVGGKFTDLKSLEEEAMMDAINKLEDTYGKNLPILLAGDFNLEVNEMGRLSRLKKKMIESFSDMNISSSDRKRVTQMYQRENRISTYAGQTDGVFVSHVLNQRVKGSQTLNFAIDNVSDHKPLMVDIDFDGIL